MSLEKRGIKMNMKPYIQKHKDIKSEMKPQIETLRPLQKHLPKPQGGAFRNHFGRFMSLTQGIRMGRIFRRFLDLLKRRYRFMILRLERPIRVIFDLVSNRFHFPMASKRCFGLAAISRSGAATHRITKWEAGGE
jgi:hypothetical protein